MVHWWVVLEARGGLECEHGSGCVEALWDRGWCGPLENFRGGYGQTVHNSLHSQIWLLELMGYGPKECLKVIGVVSDGGRGDFEAAIRVWVDGRSEGAELLIEFFL